VESTAVHCISAVQKARAAVASLLASSSQQGAPSA